MSSQPCTERTGTKVATATTPGLSDLRWRLWTWCAPRSGRTVPASGELCGVFEGRTLTGLASQEGTIARLKRSPVFRSTAQNVGSIRGLAGGPCPRTLSLASLHKPPRCRLSLFGGFQNATDTHPYALGSYLLEELNK